MGTSTDRQQFREVLTGLASRTLTKIPALNGRTEKACKLVLGGDVTLLDATTAEVESLSDPGKTYRLEKGVCSCRDYEHAPEHLCCHRLAVGFSRKIQELMPQPTNTEPVGHPGLPEARASLNFK